MKALILSGGVGTRLRPLTYTAAKQLIPIANKPVLFRVIEDVVGAGIKDVGIVVGDTKEEIKRAVGDGSRFGIDVTYIEQDAPRGLAHAVQIAKGFIGKGAFVMYLGDNVLKNGISKFVKDFEESDADARILLARAKNPERFGVVELKGEKVVRLVEKPKKPKSDLALVGVYLFKTPIFKAAGEVEPSWRNELEITDAIQGLIDSGHKVEAKLVEGWWKDTGKPEDILEANHLILDDLEPHNLGKVEGGAKISGRVGIGRGTVIKKGSVIKGPAIIGEKCEIGPETYIGPYTSIGDNTTIQGGDIEASVIIGGSVIECREKIVESLIGRNSRIVSIENRLPKGYRLIIGENSILGI